MMKKLVMLARVLASAWLGMSFSWPSSVHAIGETSQSDLLSLQRHRQQLADFNKRYFEAKRALKACNGCPEQARLRARYEQLRLLADIKIAFREHLLAKVMRNKVSAIARRATGSPVRPGMLNVYLRLYRNYNKLVGPVADGVPGQCRMVFKRWAGCLYYRYLNRNPLRMLMLQEREIVKALPFCKVSFKVYRGCREGSPVTLTKRERGLYWREISIVDTEGRYWRPMFDALASPAMRALRERGIGTYLVMLWKIKYGEPILRQLVKETDDADFRRLEARADRLLAERVAQGIYSYRLPMTPGVAYVLPVLHHETIVKRASDDPMSLLLNKSAYNWKDLKTNGLDWPFYYQENRRPRARNWHLSIASRQVLVCHYPRKVAYYWYRTPPTPFGRSSDLYQYVLFDVADQCPVQPGRTAVFRDKEKERRRLASAGTYRRWLHKPFGPNDVTRVGNRTVLFGIDVRTDTVNSAREKLKRLGFVFRTSGYCNVGFTRKQTKRCQNFVRGDYEYFYLVHTLGGQQLEGIVFSKHNLKKVPSLLLARLEKRFGAARTLPLPGDDFRMFFPHVSTGGMLLGVVNVRRPLVVRQGGRRVFNSYPRFFMLQLVYLREAPPPERGMAGQYGSSFPRAGKWQGRFTCNAYAEGAADVLATIDLSGKTYDKVRVSYRIHYPKTGRQLELIRYFSPQLVKVRTPRGTAYRLFLMASHDVSRFRQPFYITAVTGSLSLFYQEGVWHVQPGVCPNRGQPLSPVGKIGKPPASDLVEYRSRRIPPNSLSASWSCPSPSGKVQVKARIDLTRLKSQQATVDYTIRVPASRKTYHVYRNYKALFSNFMSMGAVRIFMFNRKVLPRHPYGTDHATVRTAIAREYRITMGRDRIWKGNGNPCPVSHIMFKPE